MPTAQSSPFQIQKREAMAEQKTLQNRSACILYDYSLSCSAKANHVDGSVQRGFTRGEWSGKRGITNARTKLASLIELY